MAHGEREPAIVIVAVVARRDRPVCRLARGVKAYTGGVVSFRRDPEHGGGVAPCVVPALRWVLV